MKITDVPRLTIGIEEEFQIVDAHGQLKSHIETLLSDAAGRYGDQIKREMMQSVVEAGTKICADVSEAREEIATLRGTIAALLRPAGSRRAIRRCGTGLDSPVRNPPARRGLRCR